MKGGYDADLYNTKELDIVASKKTVKKRTNKVSTSASREKNNVSKKASVSKDVKDSKKPDTLKAKAESKRVKSKLSAKDIEFFRNVLEAKRATLVGDVTQMRDQALNQSHSKMPIHMADIGTDNYEQEFTLELIENDRNLLREIDEALDRIEQGTYGICLATGKPISKSRLKHKPWAKYCIEYVREQERTNNRVR